MEDQAQAESAPLEATKRLHAPVASPMRRSSTSGRSCGARGLDAVFQRAARAATERARERLREAKRRREEAARREVIAAAAASAEVCAPASPPSARRTSTTRRHSMVRKNDPNRASSHASVSANRPLRRKTPQSSPSTSTAPVDKPKPTALAASATRSAASASSTPVRSPSVKGYAAPTLSHRRRSEAVIAAFPRSSEARVRRQSLAAAAIGTSPLRRTRPGRRQSTGAIPPKTAAKTEVGMDNLKATTRRSQKSQPAKISTKPKRTVPSKQKRLVSRSSSMMPVANRAPAARGLRRSSSLRPQGRAVVSIPAVSAGCTQEPSSTSPPPQLGRSPTAGGSPLSIVDRGGEMRLVGALARVATPTRSINSSVPAPTPTSELSAESSGDDGESESLTPANAQHRPSTLKKGTSVERMPSSSSAAELQDSSSASSSASSNSSQSSSSSTSDSSLSSRSSSRTSASTSSRSTSSGSPTSSSSSSSSSLTATAKQQNGKAAARPAACGTRASPRPVKKASSREEKRSRASLRSKSDRPAPRRRVKGTNRRAVRDTVHAGEARQLSPKKLANRPAGSGVQSQRAKRRTQHRGAPPAVTKTSDQSSSMQHRAEKLFRDPALAALARRAASKALKRPTQAGNAARVKREVSTARTAARQRKHALSIAARNARKAQQKAASKPGLLRQRGKVPAQATTSTQLSSEGECLSYGTPIEAHGESHTPLSASALRSLDRSARRGEALKVADVGTGMPTHIVGAAMVAAEDGLSPALGAWLRDAHEQPDSRSREEHVPADERRGLPPSPAHVWKAQAPEVAGAERIESVRSREILSTVPAVNSRHAETAVAVSTPTVGASAQPSSGVGAAASSVWPSTVTDGGPRDATDATAGTAQCHLDGENRPAQTSPGLTRVQRKRRRARVRELLTGVLREARRCGMPAPGHVPVLGVAVAVAERCAAGEVEAERAAPGSMVPVWMQLFDRESGLTAGARWVGQWKPSQAGELDRAAAVACGERVTGFVDMEVLQDALEGYLTGTLSWGSVLAALLEHARRASKWPKGETESGTGHAAEGHSCAGGGAGAGAV